MNNSEQPTLLWHDYETFGAVPAKDRPAQFAGIRTDLDLNIIEEPISFYCKQSPDYLPQPEAIFVTGITPQIANSRGMPEAEFMQRINQIFSQPNTCVVGYNSLRFDDEVSRYGFFRNFIDPYAREWQNNNSRWDIIDLARACYAFRPEGINWPLNEDGSPSFKLERLTAENGLTHESAHDAVSDVKATIAFAKLIKEKQPKLYEYYFNLRRKQAVSAHVDVLRMQPLVHVSSKIPAKHGCTTLIAPVAHHPDNKNAIICVNLAMDVQPLIDLEVDEIRSRMYTPRSELSEDELPIPVKQIHLNKCPFVTTAKTLTDENAQRLDIDKEFARDQYKKLKQNPHIREKLTALFSESPFANDSDIDPDESLYSGGFFSQSDKSKISIVRQTEPQNLAALELSFEDERLDKMLFRYRARNYPETLTSDEAVRWKEFCQSRLNDPDYVLKIENLLHETESDENKQKLLAALCNYLQSL